MYSELEGFDDRIGYSRASGRTTRMVEAANKYAAEHPDQYVLFIAGDYPEKRRLRQMLTEINIHVCTPYDEDRERYSYHVGFWDHYAAERELRKSLALYDDRVSGMMKYTWLGSEDDDATNS